MKKKRLKIFAASSLAIMMGASVLCGVLIAPMNSAQATISSPENATTNLTAEEQAKAEHDAKILAGGDLGLDPENDPVIYTTENGIDIKFGAATLSSGALNGYAYMTMGAYGGKAINWVIIGKSTLGSLSGIVIPYPHWIAGVPNQIDPNAFASSTPAGSAIWNDGTKNDPIMGTIATPKVVSNAEIPSGCVLCISEKNIETGEFGVVYDSGTWFTKFTDYCNPSKGTSTLGLTTTQMSYVQSTDVTTYFYYQGSSGFGLSGIGTRSVYMFPLAYKAATDEVTQNFCVETYLGSAASLRVSYNNSGNAQEWWLRCPMKRSFNRPYISTSGGYANINVDYDRDYGYRPCMVFKMTK